MEEIGMEVEMVEGGEVLVIVAIVAMMTGVEVEVGVVVEVVAEGEDVNKVRMKLGQLQK